MIVWFLPLCLLVIFELIADIFAKEWSTGRSFQWAIFSLFAYLICNSFWLLALKRGAMLGRGAMLFSVMSATLAIIVGLFYGEKITTLQWIGII